MRCKRKPPHVLNGRILTHPNQKACDEMGDRNTFVPQAAAPPPPTSTPEKPPAATSPAPAPGAKPDEKKPSFVRRFIRPTPRTPDMRPGQPAVEVSEEWELPVELAGQFWAGISTILRYAIGMVGTWFEIDEKVISKYQSSMEPNSNDLHALGSASKDFLTAAFKRAGVKSLEAAERIINALGGFSVLLALAFPLLGFFLVEIPNSPRWQKMKAKRAGKADQKQLAAGGETRVAIPDWKTGAPKAPAPAAAAA